MHKKKLIPNSYNGVDKDRIINANSTADIDNLKHYIFYQQERTKVYIKKEINKEPAPWTSNEIIRDHSFTNTRRYQDRESVWFIENVLESNMYTYNEKLLNCILYRITNKSETWKMLGGMPHFEMMNMDEQIESYRGKLEAIEYAQPDYVFFSSAYILGGTKASLGRQLTPEEPNMFMRTIRFINEVIIPDGFIDKINNAKTEKECCDIIGSYNGVGDFLVYQAFADMGYMEDFPFSSMNYAQSGPGTLRGLQWIFPDFDGLNKDEMVYYLRDNLQRLCDENDIEWNPEEMFSFLSEDLDRTWSLQCISNSLCEGDKYTRTVLGKSRPKRKFAKGNADAHRYVALANNEFDDEW